MAIATDSPLDPGPQDWQFPTAFSLWGNGERAAIDRVMASGRFTQGEEVAAFEREFADCHHRAHGIMVNSGSSANLVATAALMHSGPLKRDDVALVPAIAWSTTYAPLVQYGLKLLVVDVDGTWNADPFARSDLDKVRLVVACSVLGNPGHLDAWRTAAGVLDAPLLEDNCESLGALTPGGMHTGRFGDLSTFSFFYSHQLSAIEGGMILTDDDRLAELCRMYRAHGWTRDLVDQSKRAPGFDYEYDFQAFGYNVRALEMHAAIARAQLRRLPEFIEKRRTNEALFRELVADLPVHLPDINGVTSPFGLQFAVGSPQERPALVRALRAAGVDCRLPTGGSLRMHAYGAAVRDQETPNADFIHQCGLFLGNGPLDLTVQIHQAVEIIRATLRS